MICFLIFIALYTFFQRCASTLEANVITPCESRLIWIFDMRGSFVGCINCEISECNRERVKRFKLKNLSRNRRDYLYKVHLLNSYKIFLSNLNRFNQFFLPNLKLTTRKLDNHKILKIRFCECIAIEELK